MNMSLVGFVSAHLAQRVLPFGPYAAARGSAKDLLTCSLNKNLLSLKCLGG